MKSVVPLIASSEADSQCMRAEAVENTKMSLVSKDIELSSLPADLSHKRPDMQPPAEHCADPDREADETDPVDDRDMYYQMRAAMMSR